MKEPVFAVSWAWVWVRFISHVLLQGLMYWFGFWAQSHKPWLSSSKADPDENVNLL